MRCLVEKIGFAASIFLYPLEHMTRDPLRQDASISWPLTISTTLDPSQIASPHLPAGCCGTQNIKSPLSLHAGEYWPDVFKSVWLEGDGHKAKVRNFTFGRIIRSRVHFGPASALRAHEAASDTNRPRRICHPVKVGNAPRSASPGLA